MLQIPIHRKQSNYILNVPLFAGFTRQVVVSGYLPSTVSFIWHQKRHANLSRTNPLPCFHHHFADGFGPPLFRTGHSFALPFAWHCTRLCTTTLSFTCEMFRKLGVFEEFKWPHNPNRPNILKKTTQKKCRIVRVKMK